MVFEGIKAFFKFEKQLKEVAKITIDAKKEMNQNLSTIHEISSSMAVTSQEAATALQILSHAGITGEEAGRAIKIRFQQMLCKHDADFVFVWDSITTLWMKKCNECALEEQISELEALAIEYLKRQK